MTELLTAAQMRAIEVEAIESGRVTGLELMERAGRGVVEAIFEEWPEFEKAPYYATIICGPGNNGGDGYVIARILHERGWNLDVMYYGEPNSLPSDAQKNYLKWCEIGEAYPITYRSGSMIYETETNVVIDAVFGTGLTRPLDDTLAEVLTVDVALFRENDGGAKCVAVDIPSGISSDTGEALQAEAFKAHLTVTFHREKVGHKMKDGPEYCGKVTTIDIGLEAWADRTSE